VHDVSENLEVGREEFYQTACEEHKVQGDLVKVLYESDEIRYLVIFDTDLAGTCNENAVRRIEYDYLNVTESGHGIFHAPDEIEELILYLGHWTEEFGIEPLAIICAPWERRDLSRFDEDEGADGEPAEAAQEWRAETAAMIEYLEEKHSFIEETVVREHQHQGLTEIEILPDRFVEQARFSVDDEHYRAEIVAMVREHPPVIVNEEIRFYRNDKSGEVVGELEMPDSLQPLLRSYLDQLEDVLEEAIGGFEINSQAIEL
jgi:hypothetical protein